VVVLLFTFGCGTSKNSSTTPSPASPNPGQPVPGGNSGAEYVYALNPSVNNVTEFTLNTSTGALAMLSSSPFALSTTHSMAMAATPTTGYVFVSDWMAKSIIVLHADPASGNLSTVTTVATPELQSPSTLTVDPGGHFLYIGDGLAQLIAGYAIGSGGSLTPVPGSPYAVGQPVTSIGMDSGTHFLFAGANNVIAGYTIGSDGSLTPIAGMPVTVRAPVNNPDKGPTQVSVAIDPAAHFLYVGDTTAPQIFVYAIASSGTLTQVSGSPFQTQGVTGGLLAVSPNGKFVFDGGGGAQVLALVVGSNGSLTPAPGSPYDNGPNRSGGAPISQLVVDPTGTFLLTSNIENSNITVFSIDPNTGALTNVSGSPFPVAAKPIGGGSPYNLAVTH
jgi:6-phosphogluconolactonase (cycloisomerase 2 family)